MAKKLTDDAAKAGVARVKGERIVNGARLE